MISAGGYKVERIRHIKTMDIKIWQIKHLYDKLFL